MKRNHRIVVLSIVVAVIMGIILIKSLWIDNEKTTNKDDIITETNIDNETFEPSSDEDEDISQKTDGISAQEETSKQFDKKESDLKGNGGLKSNQEESNHSIQEKVTNQEVEDGNHNSGVNEENSSTELPFVPFY